MWLDEKQPDKKQFVLVCAGAGKILADEKACSGVILEIFCVPLKWCDF